MYVTLHCLPKSYIGCSVHILVA